MDDLLTAGRIDVSLPYIKKYAVEVLTKPYKTTQEGLEGIATDLDSTYMTKYPDVYAKKLPAIKQAITEVQRVFSTNIFPEMKLDWRTHPNNIGHLYSEGCFRCHDGQHVSKEGKVIARDCESCHIFWAGEWRLGHGQSEVGNLQSSWRRDGLRRGQLQRVPQRRSRTVRSSPLFPASHSLFPWDCDR